MKEQSPLARLFARDPASLVRYPAIPVDHALSECASIAQSLHSMSSALQQAQASPATEDEQLTSMISRLALHVWRAKGRLYDPATGEVREEMHKMQRHIQGAIEVLEQAGVRLEDWSGKAYDVGLPIKVLSYQPMPDLVQDTIIETLRPAILWKGRMIQMGEVIVGTPAKQEQ